MKSLENIEFNPEQPGILADMPRREFLDKPSGTDPPSQMRFLSFKFSRLKAVGRLFSWIALLLSFFTSTIIRYLLRQDSIEKRAVRLRREFEKRGGTFVRLGIHLSMRFDFLPWTYCVELSKLTDRMEPFPSKAAIETIERSIGMPLSTVFSQFDPEPITSTSTACIYQARFHNREQVIIKVRRPGVGQQFMTDLQAFDWLLMLAEFFTLFKLGFTQTIRNEFRTYLLEELDFVQEARRQDAFRRAAAESGKSFFSAPRVFLDMSDEEVVVEEFASGLWLWELLAAVEHKNEPILEHARSMNIDLAKVAKRLLWVNYWSFEENLFFNADPHPNNIIVGRHGKLYFVNFSTTGTLNRSKLQALQQNMFYIQQRDPQNMARSSLILLEPLPPIDLIQLTQELESFNWQYLYNLETIPESLTWQERTSAVQWIGMINLARKYGILIDTRVLRLIRSLLLTESSAVRLFHGVDIMRVYEKFERYRAERARRRVTDKVLAQMDGEINERLIIRLDRIADTLQGLFFRTRHMLTLPSVNFSTLMSKWSFAVFIFFRFLLEFAVLTGVSITIFLGVSILNGLETFDPGAILSSVFGNPVFQILTLVLIFINGNSVLFRLDDKET